MFLNFSEEAQKMLLLSLKEKNKLNEEYISSEHIILALLTLKNNSVCKIFNECGVYYNNVFDLLEKKNNKNNNFYIFSPLLNNVFLNLLNTKKEDIDINDIIVEILSNSNSKGIYLLKKLDINVSDLLKMVKGNIKVNKKNHKSILKDLGVNLNEVECFNVVERDEEINSIMEVLCCKNKNNPVLLGDAGVGKTAIVEEIAKRIKMGMVPKQLINKKIYSISMSSLVAGTKYRGEFEDKINKLISEVENDEDIILFIDEIHTLIGAGGAEGAIDASNILKPVLARGKIKLIGATTKEEYDKYILNDKALNRRFKIIMIEEPDSKKVEKILLSLKENYEKYHGVIIDNSLINKIIFYCDRYIKDKKYPDKAIDILDEVCVSVLFDSNNNKIINLDKEKQEIINLKNKSLLSSNYESAIEYSKREKKINKALSKFNKNNMKVVISVDEKHLLKVMERKTNLPFYSYLYNKKSISNRFDEFKKNTFLEDKTYNSIFDITSRIYFNLINNHIHNEIYFYLNIDNDIVKKYISTFFKNIPIINLDINNYNYVDDLLNESLLNKIDKYNLYIFNIYNYDKCDKSIKEFFEKLKIDGYYIDKNNKYYSFKNGLFIYSNKYCCSRLGFNNSYNLNTNSIIINGFSTKKLRYIINKTCMEKNIMLDENNINEIINTLIKEKKIEDIEFYINKFNRTKPFKTSKMGI